MIGASLNALGILAGALTGLTQRQPFSAQTQYYFKSAIGVGAVLLGLHLIWLSINGTFTAGLKELFLMLLALVLGYWIGRLLNLQKISNRVGRKAAEQLAIAQKKRPGRVSAGIMAATALFCAAPLGIVGAVVDGLKDYFYVLALKAVMDGLAMASFVRLFPWPVALSALPVLVFLEGITLMTHVYAAPFLAAHHWTDPVCAVAGFIVLATAIVIFEVRRVELANFLPALVLAPLLARLFQ